MSPSHKIHQEHFKIRSFECAPTGRLSPAALWRLAQEAADSHFATFGMSMLDVRAHGKIWVFSRLQLRMSRYPVVGDLVTIETWGSKRTKGVRAYREFRFVDQHGATLGQAICILLLLDEKRKRPVRLPAACLQVCDVENVQELSLARLKGPEQPSRRRTFEVGWKELDANNHSNNANFIEWTLEALPLETLRQKMLATLDVEFLAEAFYGDQVISEVEIIENSGTHHLKNAAGLLLGLATTEYI